MAIAFDVKSQKAGSSTLTWNHTPVGTPRAIVVCVGMPYGADGVATVTYGGIAMTEITGSPLIQTDEAMSVYAYFLGANIPTGVQSVVVTKTSGAGGVNSGAICVSLTAATDTTEVQAVNTSINSTSVANPSDTLALGGITCWVIETFMSGQDTISGIAPPAGWTTQLEYDLGTVTFGNYSYDIVGSTDVTIGWTQTAENAACIAVGIAEVSTSTYTLTATVATFVLDDFGVWLHKSNRTIPITTATFTLTTKAAGLKTTRVLTAATATFIVTGRTADLIKVGTASVIFDVDTATFTATAKKARLIHFVPLGLTLMHKKTLVLDALVTQLQALPEVMTATRVLLTPINARKASPYVGLIAGPEEIVVEDTANIRYELDVDLILLKRGTDIETMLDAVKELLFDTTLPVTLDVLQIRVVGQEPVALVDDDKFSSTRIVMVITYVVTKGAF